MMYFVHKTDPYFSAMIFSIFFYRLKVEYLKIAHSLSCLFVSLVNFVILVFSAILFQMQITVYNILGLIFISVGF